MKNKFILFILSFLFTNTLLSQNLILNPGFEAGGSGEATFKDGKATIGVSGDVAVLIGLDVDVSVTVDTKQVQKDVNVVTNKVVKIVNDPHLKQATNDAAKKTVNEINNTAKKTGNEINNTAKKTGNEISKGLKKIHF